jgi:hypothetical protein
VFPPLSLRVRFSSFSKTATPGRGSAAARQRIRPQPITAPEAIKAQKNQRIPAFAAAIDGVDFNRRGG